MEAELDAMEDATFGVPGVANMSATEANARARAGKFRDI